MSPPANAPDDWAAHWRRCILCGRQLHASELGCECEWWWAEASRDGEEMMPVDDKGGAADEGQTTARRARPAAGI